MTGDLTSCYFCGTAVELPVEEYPVVPEGVAPEGESGPTVWLCPACHRKLDRVVGAVVRTVAGPAGHEGATGQSQVEGEDTHSEGESGAAVVESGEGAEIPDDATVWESIQDDPAATSDASTDVGESEGATGSTDRDDQHGRGSTSEGDTAGTGPPDVGPRLGEDGPIFGDPADRPAPGDRPEQEDAEGQQGRGDAAARSDPGTVADGPAWGGGDDRSGSGDGEDHSPSRARDQGSGAGDPPPGSAASGPVSVDPGVESGSSGEDHPPETGGSDESGNRAENTANVSVEAYNRLVRLLRNREFPVERTEIVEVATSAYDLTNEECRLALAAMVDRGVVGEEGTELVRVDDRGAGGSGRQ